MNLFRIHPAPGVPSICTIATDGDSDHALEVARGNPWIGPQLTDEACAEQAEEVAEWI